MRLGPCAATLLFSVALGLPASAEDFTWRGRIPAGKSIEVKGINGAILAEPTGGDEVEVEASKTGRRSDPEEVEVRLVEHAGGVTICAVYPTGWGAAPNECRPGAGGRMNTRNNDVKVEFRVKVPAGVAFAGRTVNGGVTAEGLEGDVEAHTVNGGVRVSTRGLARAETVNGSIVASMGRANWSGPLQFETVNGSIEVHLPAGASAEVEARTVNGSIQTDFPLAVSGRFSRRRLSGTIGAGGRQLDLETVNGSIHLRKR